MMFISGFIEFKCYANVCFAFQQNERQNLIPTMIRDALAKNSYSSASKKFNVKYYSCS